MAGRIVLSVTLLVAQALLFNHVGFESYGTPMVCVYVLLIRNLQTSRTELLLWGFLMGLCQDSFANTPGMNAAGLTLIGLMQPVLLKLFASGDFLNDETGISPSVRSLGWRAFMLYSFACVFLQQTVYYLLEYFSFADMPQIGLHVLAGAACSWLCILAFEGVRRPYRGEDS